MAIRSSWRSASPARLADAASSRRATQQPQQPQQQDEFVPIDQLPPQDQLPAAPLLVAAYVFVVLALFAYVVSVARRLGAVQREVERLESDLKRSRADLMPTAAHFLYIPGVLLLGIVIGWILGRAPPPTRTRRSCGRRTPDATKPGEQRILV